MLVVRKQDIGVEVSLINDIRTIEMKSIIGQSTGLTTILHIVWGTTSLVDG